MSATYTVQQLITDVRINTNLKNAQQISDQEILYRLNIFLTQDMPQEIQQLCYKTTYSFTTYPHQGSYVLPVNQYNGIFGAVFVAGLPVYTTQDANLFYSQWMLSNITASPLTGNGSTTYTFQIQTPALRGYTDALGTLYPAVYINTVAPDGSPQTVVDNGSGTLLSDQADPSSTCGTINYLSGAVTVAFPSPTMAPIYVNEQVYAACQPTACLFYNNTFFLRNIPDKSYVVSVNAYVNPAAYPDLPGGYNAPVIIQNQFKYFVYGTARYILTLYKDMSQLEIIDRLYREQELMLMRISSRQRFKERVRTIFNSQYNATYNSNF